MLSPTFNRAQSQLRSLLGHLSLQTILDLVADTPDSEAEQRTLHQMAASGLRVVWHEVSVVSGNPLDLARASLQLNYGMQHKLGEYLMPDNSPSKISAQIHAALYDMDAHLTPTNRASIRSAATELPIDAWLALAAAPVSDMNHLKTRLVWETDPFERLLSCGRVAPTSAKSWQGPIILRRACRRYLLLVVKH